MSPPRGRRPTKRGLEFRIDKNHISTLGLYFKEAELVSIIESSIRKFYPGNHQLVFQTFREAM
eukprot:6931907-Heterocapsa_arctica.AAC.1